jgi:hypothetical protein
MRSEPDWRTYHCGDLAAEAIRAASGRDVWPELGGRPQSNREGAALYRRVGARTLRGVMTWLLGPPIDRRKAHRGDVVMVRGSLGVCRGEVAECLGAVVPMREVDLAWPSKGSPEYRA